MRVLKEGHSTGLEIHKIDTFLRLKMFMKDRGNDHIFHWCSIWSSIKDAKMCSSQLCFDMVWWHHLDYCLRFSDYLMSNHIAWLRFQKDTFHSRCCTSYWGTHWVPLNHNCEFLWFNAFNWKNKWFTIPIPNCNGQI